MSLFVFSVSLWRIADECRRFGHSPSCPDIHKLPPGHRHHRGLLMDSGVLHARIQRLPRPIVKNDAYPLFRLLPGGDGKDYASPFPLLSRIMPVLSCL